MTEDEWAPLAARLALLFPRESFDQWNAEAYLGLLDDLDAGWVALALGDITKEVDRLPSAAHIRRHAVTLRDLHNTKHRLPERNRSAPTMTFREWIAAGCPDGEGGSAYDPVDAERIMRGYAEVRP